eukprot:TRINITY_DN8012_c0_g1_i1.p1 TRINITY_DN8012_c0_g1~~TRINITY_DN8012_c0_g1_i1.p1  ORF type:complete len:632 (+),score=177.53 TRINITY_DN8012_c0_g1_i1:70-1965(+)
MWWPRRLLAVAAVCIFFPLSDVASALTLSRKAGHRHHKEHHGVKHHKRHHDKKKKGLLHRHKKKAISLAQTSSTKKTGQPKADAKDGKDQKKAAGVNVDVYYTAEMLDKLKMVTEKRKVAAETRFNNEHTRLTAALERASKPSDQALLQETIAKVESFRQEEEIAVNEMMKFYYTTKAALGARGADAPTCQFLQCGENAGCKVSPMGTAHCSCNNCFKGDGFVCKPHICGASADAFMGAQPLINLRQDPRMYLKPVVAEIHATSFGDNMVAVVYRDSHDGDRGFFKVGYVGEMGVKWSQVQGFSGDLPAFGPVVQGLSNGRLLVSFRDTDVDGSGYFVGGEYNGDLKAMSNSSFRSPQLFSKKQAQKVALVPLSTSRVACLYAGRTPLGPATEEAFGAAMLVQVLRAGSISILGKYHFANDLRVARIAATALSPTSFVVAYRGLPPTDEAVQPGTPSQELSMAWIGMRDEELVVEQQALRLEPTKREMWSRDVSVISAQLFGYTYYSSQERKTKLAVIHVDPENHRFTLTNDPTTVGLGISNFVQSTSLASPLSTPRAFVSYQEPGRKASAEVCKVGSDGKVTACSQAGWADAELHAASTTRLKDGRLFLAYADKGGAPWYQAFGAAEFMQ